MNYSLSTGPEQLREAINASLLAFIEKENERLREVAIELAPVASAMHEFLLDSGKRFRPLFAAAGFVGSGGTLDQQSLNAIASIELVHVCALIHDDVMDGSDTRRGAPSIHKRFEAMHRESRLSGSGAQFGSASAILLGDLALVWAAKALHDSGVSQEALLRALPIYDEMRIELMAGQYLDIYEQVLASGSIDRSLKVAQYKSGKYSIERPLHFGAKLAGETQLNCYSQYGIPLGEAFQLRDDLLGVFGNPSETGKPAGDDLREGKRTVLIAATLEKSSPSEINFINSKLGNAALTQEEIETLVELIVASGAPARVEVLIEEKTEEALIALHNSPIADEAKEFLNKMALLATKRKF